MLGYSWWLGYLCLHRRRRSLQGGGRQWNSFDVSCAGHFLQYLGWREKRIPVWSYLLAFRLGDHRCRALFTESGKYTAYMGDAHKYTKLLWICLVILVVSCTAFAIGAGKQ